MISNFPEKITKNSISDGAQAIPKHKSEICENIDIYNKLNFAESLSKYLNK